MENLEQLKNFNFSDLYSNLTESLNAGGIVVYIIAAAILALFALFGYKLQKACVAAACAAGVAVFSLSFCMKILENETLGYVSAGVLALITFFVIFKLYIKIVSLAVAIAGGAVVYITIAPEIANKIIEATQLSFPMVDSVLRVFVALLGGLLAGILAKFVFKYLVIIATSFGGAAGVTYNVALIANQNFGIAFIIVAAILGIACCIFQFNNNKHNE